MSLPDVQHNAAVAQVKQREGIIERLLTPDGRSAVCRGFFKKESDFSVFIGMKVEDRTIGSHPLSQACVIICFDLIDGSARTSQGVYNSCRSGLPAGLLA